jgi:hypothetical protein
MYRVALVIAVCACGSKEPGPAVAGDPGPAPADHQLHRSDSPGRIQITGAAVPLASQPTMEWFGLPMSGDVDVAIDLHHLDEPAKAAGSIRISCPTGCRIGDDKTTIKPATKNGRSAAFASELYFGHVAFDRVTIAVDIKDGKGTISTFDVVSQDVILKLAGTIELAKPFADSRVDLCLRFDGTQTLQARDPKTHALLALSGAPRASDGLFNIKLVDRLGAVKRLGVACDGSAPTAPTAPDAPITRPTLESDAAAPPSNDVDPATAKLIAAAVKKTSATSYEIDRATWEKLLADPTAIAKGSRMVPAMKGGKPAGFKLYAIRPDSFYAALGLQNGDTVVAIAEQPLGSVDQLLTLYAQIRDTKPGEPIHVDLERKGARIRLTYRFTATPTR